MAAPLRTTALEIPVAGGTLRAYRLGDPDASPVLAVHGITSSSHAWPAVARALDGRASLLAIDLRGRGRSSTLPPPYGIAAHADDLVRVLDHLELGSAVVAGHSLGAYITARLAADHPERVRYALLIDGGLTIPGSERIDPQAFLDAFLGPAIARLRMAFADRQAYRDWWRGHPALAGADVADEDLYAYADHDLVGDEPAMHSCINEDAVRADGSELFELDEPAHRLTVPAALMCAPRGLLDDPHPMQPQTLAVQWAAEAPERRAAIQVPDVNHYTIIMGAGGAVAVADQIAAAAARAVPG